MKWLDIGVTSKQKQRTPYEIKKLERCGHQGKVEQWWQHSYLYEAQSSIIYRRKGDRAEEEIRSRGGGGGNLGGQGERGKKNSSSGRDTARVSSTKITR